MAVGDFWRFIYLIARLEKDNVCTLKLNLFYINLIFLIMEKIFYTVKTYVFRFEESFIDLNKSNKMKSKFFFVLILITIVSVVYSFFNAMVRNIASLERVSLCFNSSFNLNFKFYFK